MAKVRKINLFDFRHHISHILNEIQDTGLEVVIVRTGNRSMKKGPVARVVPYKESDSDVLEYSEDDA